MKIGMIIAIPEEINILNQKLSIYKTNHIYSILGMNIYIYKLYYTTIFLIQSGIGKISSSIACCILINKYKVKFIINIGSAGSVNNNIKILDIILATDLIYHDVNLTNWGYAIGQIPKLPKSFHTNYILRNNIKDIFHQYNIRYHEGLIISGDSFIKDKKNIIQSFPYALSVDMESASIGQVCFQLQKPILIIKIISDLCNNHSSKIFKKHINKISYKIYKIIKYFINISYHETIY